MIVLSLEELEKVRQAGKVVTLVHNAVEKEIVPGMTTKDIDKIASRVINEYGMQSSYHTFGVSVFVSVNDIVKNGIPDDTVLKDGDFFSLEVSICNDGYHCAATETYPVGRCSKERNDMVEVSEQCLDDALDLIRNGVRASDISHSIQMSILNAGMSIPVEFSSHGIGKQAVQEPYIDNYGLAGRGPILRTGMVLAIEPIMIKGKRHIHFLNNELTACTDDGSDACSIKETILVLDDGYEVLTDL